MADRATFNGTSTEVPWQDTAETPEGFGNQYARHITTLYDASALPLTSVGGTGDNVTATVDPSLPPGGLRDGMKFGITWAVANTGPMTLTITGSGAAPVLSADGAVAGPGLAVVGGRALLEYVGGAFRVLSGGAGSGGTARYYWQFTASGTWTKPAGLPDDAMVTVEAWGGGGGGSGHATNGGGGGGGGYSRREFRISDLPTSIPIAVAAGGNVEIGTMGGNSTFGALLTAYGGAGGLGATATAGGGGGGVLGPGSGITAGPGGGGQGGSAGSDGTNLWGGGGGGGTSGKGGASIFGGGGGSGSGAIGGRSVFGGAGGSGWGAPGTVPGGGGARNGMGARGEVRIWI